MAVWHCMFFYGHAVLYNEIQSNLIPKWMFVLGAFFTFTYINCIWLNLFFNLYKTLFLKPDVLIFSFQRGQAQNSWTWKDHTEEKGGCCQKEMKIYFIKILFYKVAHTQFCC